MTDTCNGTGDTFGDVMRDVIVRTYHNDSRNGLLLLPFPTGVGKTYAVKRAIAVLASERRPESAPIVYLTPQHKNIPSESEIEDLLRAAGVEVGEHDVMYLRSVFDTIVERATPELLDCIPADLRKETGAEDFFALVRLVNGDANQRKLLERSFKEFRRKIRGALSAVEGESAKRMDLIETSDRWSWVHELWPQTLARRAKVLLMTATKFFSSFDTLVEPVRSLDSYEWMTDTIIFMDEFDSVKNVLLDVIVRESTASRADLAGIVRTLNANVDPSKMPASIFSSKSSEKGQRRVKKLAEMLSEVSAALNIDFRYKANDDVLSPEGLFTYDGTRKGISVDDCYYVVSDEDGRQNLISKEAGEQSRRLSRDTASLRGAVAYAQKVIASLIVDVHGFGVPDLHEDALGAEIESMLDEFGIRGGSERQLMSNGIRIAIAKMAGRRHCMGVGATLYDQKLGLVCLKDSERHRFSTHIYAYELDETPESRLRDLVKKNYVFGISASAGIDSPLSNFDLTWFRKLLEPFMKSISREDSKLLEEAFVRHVAGYDAVSIRVEAIDLNVADSAGCLSIAQATETESSRLEQQVCNIFEEVVSHVGKSNANSAVPRYARVMCAYRYFLEHVPEGVFLCVTQTAPKDGGAVPDADYANETVDELLGLVRRDMHLDESAGPVRYISDSTGFEKNYRAIVAELRRCRRIFLCASYATLSKGVNLQYELDGMITVRVGNVARRDERVDVVGMYLDRVTNVVPTRVRMDEDDREQALLKGVFAVKELWWNADISTDECTNWIKRLNGKGRLPKVTELSRVRAAATATCVQMIGRMCRTQNKAPVIHILFDSDLPRRIDPYCLGSSMVGKETELFLAKMKEYVTDRKEPASRAYRLCEARAMAVASDLSKKAQSNWSNTEMREWESLRTDLLECPCPSESDFKENARWRLYFMEVPEGVDSYRYSQKGDFAVACSISFDLADTGRFEHEVSEREARLRELASVPEVQRRFDEKGWKLSWEAKGYLMHAPLFTNIYLGAIGEQAGKAILEERIAGLMLANIEDHSKFEKFDFVVEGKNAYVDFKNWRHAYERKDDLDHIEEKKSLIEASYCIIVNLMAGEELKDMRCSEVRRDVFEVPYLVDSNGMVSIERIMELRNWLRQKGVVA